MTRVQLADQIKEEAMEQRQEPAEPLGTEEQKTEPKPKPKPAKKRATPKKKEPEPEAEAKPVPRQSTWILEDHFDRLDALKLRQKRRLKQEGKRVSVTSLIDEAIDQYLEKME